MRHDESKRSPLTRQRVLVTAIALADAHGLGAVTMRRLAREVGVEAMSLYHHVRNKDDLLDGMVDTIFAEIEVPSEHEDWMTGMARRAASLRAALTRHPWAISVMDSRKHPGPATLRHHDAVIGSCLAAGFSVEMAAHAFSLIDSYVYGFALQEIALPFDHASDLKETVESILPGELREAYPHLAVLTEEFVLKPGYSHADEFAFGLDLVLTSLDTAGRADSRG
jgi:AcrR family transcriptional regulator